MDTIKPSQEYLRSVAKWGLRLSGAGAPARGDRKLSPPPMMTSGSVSVGLSGGLSTTRGFSFNWPLRGRTATRPGSPVCSTFAPYVRNTTRRLRRQYATPPASSRSSRTAAPMVTLSMVDSDDPVGLSVLLLPDRCNWVGAHDGTLVGAGVTSSAAGDSVGRRIGGLVGERLGVVGGSVGGVVGGVVGGEVGGLVGGRTGGTVALHSLQSHEQPTALHSM